MTGRGRYKAKEWAEFEPCYLENGKLDKQKCRHCNSKVSSKIERVKEHLKKCSEYVKKNSVQNDLEDDIAIDETSLSSTVELDSTPLPSTSADGSASREQGNKFHPMFASTPCSKRKSTDNISSASISERAPDDGNDEYEASVLKKQKTGGFSSTQYR